MPEIRAGHMIAGHRLLERIGSGRFGEVWKADYQGRNVALKLFDTRLHPDHVRREAFAQSSLSRLDGRSGRFFPRIEAVELDHTPPYLRMELVEGRSLEDVLAERTLPLSDRLALGRNILEALAVAHGHGFVHGDLSPGNVLIAADGSVKLIDVGFGGRSEEGMRDIERSGEADEQWMGVASPLYAAPERFRAEFLAGGAKAADVFSFGKILYALMTGETPLVIKPVSRKRPALSAAWDDFLFRCLEEDPGRRFSDAPAALADFDRIHGAELREGEFRAECPECGARMSIPGRWDGERFTCRGCALTLEVLFYDEERRHASTAVVADAQEAMREEIEFLDEDPPRPAADDRARKFCLACGRGIYAEAKKCRHCGTWVDETARKFVAALRSRRRLDHESAAAARRSYMLPALATFLAYFLFWVPGAILNFYYLYEARRTAKLAGARPSGTAVLEIMMCLGVYLPLGFLAAALFCLGAADSIASFARRLL
ncbi:MAG: protein kinase [Planctomycetes bacterium]|nr:protein kinase [Planctomycetota bacterium]